MIFPITYLLLHFAINISAMIRIESLLNVLMLTQPCNG